MLRVVSFPLTPSFPVGGTNSFFDPVALLRGEPTLPRECTPPSLARAFPALTMLHPAAESARGRRSSSSCASPLIPRRVRGEGGGGGGRGGGTRGSSLEKRTAVAVPAGERVRTFATVIPAPRSPRRDSPRPFLNNKLSSCFAARTERTESHYCHGSIPPPMVDAVGRCVIRESARPASRCLRRSFLLPSLLLPPHLSFPPRVLCQSRDKSARCR